MLQRSTSNVCSLWLASHVRTKQSKWLDSNVQEMEEKVKTIIKLIDQDGDSFAKKAELYFRRRPELINHVEELYRAYNALADRYDRISGELHKANHTIATALPDQLQLAMDDDEDGMTPRALASIDPSQLSKPVEVPQLVQKKKKTEVPQPVLTNKNTEVPQPVLENKNIEVPQLVLMNKNAEECSTPKRTQHKKISPPISFDGISKKLQSLEDQEQIIEIQQEVQINEDCLQIKVTADNKTQEKANEKHVEKTENFQDGANKEGEVKAAYQVSRKDDGQVQAQVEQLVDAPDFKGLLYDEEGRDKMLLAECSSIVCTYKETKQILSELEKNKEHDSEVMAQLKELKIANAMKDEEIRILRDILSSLQANEKQNASHNYANMDERVVYLISKPNSPLATKTKIPSPDENAKVSHEYEPQTYLTAKDKLRTEIDALLDENLDYCLRFSNMYDEIQKIQKTFKELQTEIIKLEKDKLQDASGTAMIAVRESLKQDSALLEKRLSELNTEVQDCLEKNSRLKAELHCRFTSLGSIFNEISRISETSKSENRQITLHQAAKFQGEVLNMKLQTKKVDKELQDCMDHVKGLQVDIAKTLSKLHENFELSASSYQSNQLDNKSTKARIPLSTFLFGVKPKKRSIFGRISSNRLLKN